MTVDNNKLEATQHRMAEENPKDVLEEQDHKQYWPLSSFELLLTNY